MIYIDLFNNPPPQDLIDEGVRLTNKLFALPPDERTKFIDAHADYWGKLKPYYSALSHGKCWYTESKDIASAYHMDHFRPKKKTIPLMRNCTISTTNSNESYWWLAFDWTNYRFAASVPNSSKNAYFPLKPGTFAAKNKEELENEWNGLLDPTDEYDVSLIAYSTEGKVWPSCEDVNGWDALRVMLSVRVYNLNCIPLVDARKEVQQVCKAKIEFIKKAQREYAETRSTKYRDMLKKYVSELREMAKPASELSSVARNYIRNDPEEFIRNIAV